MARNIEYAATLSISMLIAFASFALPTGQMPLGYLAMMTLSIPCAILWAVFLGISLRRLGKRGLWLLVGAPFALWWPVWIIFNRFPPCYYAHRCF